MRPRQSGSLNFPSATRLS